MPQIGPVEFTFTWSFLWDLVNITIIDLVLSGDNAILIGMAVRWLPHEKRKKGLIIGSGVAVAARVFLTFVIMEILWIPFVKLAGGAVILSIAVKLFVKGFPDGEEREAASLFQAVRMMVVADLTMSFENMIAIAGASHGDYLVLLLGLGISIPFIVFTSGLFSMLMDRYSFIIYIGAAILGKVGGEMMITDKFLKDFFTPPAYVRYGFEAFCALAVIFIGRICLNRVNGPNRSAEAARQPGETVEE